MTVLIRADASAEIGTGHVMRCLSLATELMALGEDVVFAARSMFPTLRARIEAAGCRFVALPPATSRNDARAGTIPHAHWLQASADDDAAATLAAARAARAAWVVVDHYGVDSVWQRILRAGGVNVAALDDLADRAHAADLLVDPSLSADPHGRYAALIPANRQQLLGPRYAILRPEFRTGAARPPHDGPLRWLIAFGGVDAAGCTQRAMAALAEAQPDTADVTVVVGGQNADLAAIRAKAAALGWQVHVDSDAMGALMASADVAIGAGGHMLWERAAMRLPTIALIVAENQREQVTNAAAGRLVLPLDAARLDPSDLVNAVRTLGGDAARRAAMAAACGEAVDGKRALRIARRIADLGIQVAPAAVEDILPMHAWRNDARIRAVSREHAEISLGGHRDWCAAVMADPDRHLLVGRDKTGPLGVVRFDRSGDRAEVSIYLAPARLGQGLGPNLLLAAEAWLIRADRRIAALDAEVLDGNRASEELFLGTGYTRLRPGHFAKALEVAP